MGSIYIFGATDSGPVKIGSSASPQKRLSHIQIGNPVRLYALRVWDHPFAGRVETATHKLLKSLRLQGEWFSVGLEAASKAVEQAIAGYQPPEPSLTVMPTENVSHVATNIEIAQRKRIDQIEAIEIALGRRLSRREVIQRELAGEFGDEWREVRVAQGWR